MNRLVSFILKMMARGGKKVAAELEKESLDPRKEQERLLRDILSDAAGSEIARKYGFGTIDSVRTFQERLPITDYDDYASSVTRMMKGENNVLTDQEIVHYNVTSGTLGVPKKIPVTEKHVAAFSRINAKYLNYLAVNSFGKEWTKGKGFSLSEGTYEVLPTGVSVGCASSLHTARMSKMKGPVRMDPMAMMYTSPKEARMPRVTGPYTRYLHARFAMEERNVTYGNATFSSYLLEIFRYIENNYDLIVNDIEQGTVSPKISMPEDVRLSVLRQVRPMPERARELREAASAGFEKGQVMSRIWPKLRYFLCVGGGGFQTYTDKVLSRYVSPDVHLIYMGLTSSEGLYSVPLQPDTPDSMLVPDTTFMEFIPVKDGQGDLSQGTRLIDELETGKQYELVITNVSGLYRYRLGDIIEVTGFHHKTPLIRFVDRAGFAISMYAEKTSEIALRNTVKTIVGEHQLDLTDYCVVPFEGKKYGQYIFLLECHDTGREKPDLRTLKEETEKALRENNPVYGESVTEGRLIPLDVRFLQEQTFALYKDLMVLKGASSAQLKPVHVTRTPFQQGFFLKLVDSEEKTDNDGEKPKENNL